MSTGTQPGNEPPVIRAPEAMDPPLIRSAPGVPVDPLRAIIIYLLIVFVGAAVISPRIYASMQFLAENHFRLRGLAEVPFHRVVNRCLILVALLGLPTFFRALRIRSRAAIGLDGGPRRWAEALQGLGWGFAALAMAAAFAITFHARTLDLAHTGAQWSKHIQGAAITAIIVATLEEILFRGALFGTLRRGKSFWRAALISSGIYAILHFFEKPPEPGSVEAWTGFVVLSQMLRGFADWHALIPGFFNLLLVGLLLALAFERTGAILFSIGLHAGFIFWVKSYGFLTDARPGASEWFWGSNKLVDGWVTAFLLLTMFLVLQRTLPNKPPSGGEPP